MEGKAESARRHYVRLRLITVVGAVIVPVLVGLNIDDRGVEAATIGAQPHRRDLRGDRAVLPLRRALAALPSQRRAAEVRGLAVLRAGRRLRGGGRDPRERVPGLRAARRGDPAGRDRHLHQRRRRRASTGEGPAGGLMAAGPAYAAFISYSRADRRPAGAAPAECARALRQALVPAARGARLPRRREPVGESGALELAHRSARPRGATSSCSPRPARPPPSGSGTRSTTGSSTATAPGCCSC